MDYAIALSSRLASKGIHGQLIFYRWHIRNTATNGSHVFVAYRLSDGTKWIVDNELSASQRQSRWTRARCSLFICWLGRRLRLLMSNFRKD